MSTTDTSEPSEPSVVPKQRMTHTEYYRLYRQREEYQQSRERHLMNSTDRFVASLADDGIVERLEDENGVVSFQCKVCLRRFKSVNKFSFDAHLQTKHHRLAVFTQQSVQESAS